MKYANLKYVAGADLDSKTSRINIGDYMQLIAIDAMYKEMGIPDSEIYHITIDEMKNYKGEYLILPINFMFTDFLFCNNEHIAISNHIIPVFIGVCLYRDGVTLNEYNINYFKHFAPIGCRDYNTYMLLKQYDIPAYVSGCITFTLPQREKATYDTVYFVDVPDFVRDEIPPFFFEKCKFIHHERELSKEQFYDEKYAMNISRKLLQEYRDNAKLIVTSRLHCATPALATGIPTILVREYRGYTFDWIDQFIPIYLWDNRKEIDWWPKGKNFEKEKSIILQTAIQRVKKAKEKFYYLEVEELYSHYYMRTDHTILNCQSIHSSKIAEKLRIAWKANDNISYALWGISESAEEIYSYIQEHYPNAQLVKIIDTYRNIEFHGIQSEKPEILKEHNDFFTIVISINAVNAAKPFFQRIHKPAKEYLLMADSFMDSV